MAKICLSLTAKTLSRNLEILNKYRKYIDLAELRVDCLDPDESLSLRRFPAMAGLPVILTIRRTIEGGLFSGGEAARIILLSKGLAFAEADRRNNFSYVELEEDVNVPGIVEAARAFGTRIIRSYHNIHGMDMDLTAKLRGLRRYEDEIAKVVVMPHSLDDVAKLYRTAAETGGMDKILLCLGDYGANTRILAERLGCFLSHVTIKGESDVPPAFPGQLDPIELAETFRFRSIKRDTKIFALTGFPLKVSSSIRFFNKVFSIEKDDAVYVPFPSDSFESMIALASEINIAGIAVTIPHKEASTLSLSWGSEQVRSTGACNTLVAGEQGWMGYNTDVWGFSDSLLNFSGLKNLKGRKITIVGTGGSARAVCAVVSALKGKALILNRTVVKARTLAAQYGFAWGGLDSQGFGMMKKYSDIIIQTTPVGMEGGLDADLLDFYQFTGKELVMDLIYNPKKTRCLLRAEQAGCKILNGYDMLLRMARYQYKYFIGKEFPPSLVDRVGLLESF
ncbi:MAG: type I 3-dehydroquinate dehydratase [Treponema sp.]|jgi:3-dehydroquinate dehydratase/shikimate dehydrogenase|nr:type I 3-dehydroquinate dehydratase [Treponema sp.]